MLTIKPFLETRLLLTRPVDGHMLEVTDGDCYQKQVSNIKYQLLTIDHCLTENTSSGFEMFLIG